MHAKQPPAWVRSMQPRPENAVSFVRRAGDWEVEGRWWWLPGEARTPAPIGPREVIIRPTPDLGPDAVRRGITTTVMRHAEKLIGDFQREYFGADEHKESERMFRDALRDRASKLPASPRADPGSYYQGILDLFDIIEAVSNEPVQVLADVLDVSPNTVKTRLRNARQRQSESKR